MPIILIVNTKPGDRFVGISAGALRHPIKRFLLIVWVGKTAKGIIYAHTCYWKVQWVRWPDWISLFEVDEPPYNGVVWAWLNCLSLLWASY